MNGDREYAKAWLAELWPTVHEWHQSPEVEAQTAARNELLAVSRESGAEPERQAS